MNFSCFLFGHSMFNRFIWPNSTYCENVWKISEKIMYENYSLFFLREQCRHYLVIINLTYNVRELYRNAELKPVNTKSSL